MTRPVLKNSLRWMLAVWTVSATVFVSPAVVHSHDEGDRPHHHDGDDGDSGVFSGLPLPTARHEGHEGAAYLSAADFHEHGGLRLLGSANYRPSPTDPCGPQDKSPGNWEVIVAAAATANVRADSNGVALSHWGLASAADLSVDCVCPSGYRDVRGCDVGVASPLCDRARHERSGVQLA